MKSELSSCNYLQPAFCNLCHNELLVSYNDWRKGGICDYFNFDNSFSKVQTKAFYITKQSLRLFILKIKTKSYESPQILRCQVQKIEKKTN